MTFYIDTWRVGKVFRLLFLVPSTPRFPVPTWKSSECYQQINWKNRRSRGCDVGKVFNYFPGESKHNNNKVSKEKFPAKFSATRRRKTNKIKILPVRARARRRWKIPHERKSCNVIKLIGLICWRKKAERDRSRVKFDWWINETKKSENSFWITI